MRIILVGSGKVGHTIAERLTYEKHDVVIIDRDLDVLHKVQDTLDVLCLYGNGANAKILQDAQADKADILIATTASDEVNMLCCLIAKRLGTKKVVARIRDPEYNESVNLLQKEMGIDFVINPELATAQEISRMLRFPFASNIESFARGRVEMAEFRAMENDAITGLPLREISQKCHGIPRVLYAAVERDGNVFIPAGDFRIEAGDRVYVAAESATVTAFFQYLGRNTVHIKHVLLMGGGRISYYLAKMLVPMGFHVSIIEIDEKKADALAESLPGVNVICGDATEQTILEQEGLQEMDAFVTLSNRDEENLMTGLFAAREGVPKVIVKNNRVAYADVIGAMGLDSVVSPKFITCANILRFVRVCVNGEGTKVERLHRLLSGKVEALEFIARSVDPYISIPLRNLKTRTGTLIAVIVRNGTVIIPFGDDCIEAGDRVIIITRHSGISDLNEVISK